MALSLPLLFSGQSDENGLPYQQLLDDGHGALHAHVIIRRARLLSIVTRSTFGFLYCLFIRAPPPFVLPAHTPRPDSE